MKTGARSSNSPQSREIYVVTKFSQPIRTFESLAQAWLFCFEQGFVVARGRHRPGSTAAQRKHRLDYGIHVVAATVTKAPPKKRWGDKKIRYNPDNWIDEL